MALLPLQRKDQGGLQFGKSELVERVKGVKRKEIKQWQCDEEKGKQCSTASVSLYYYYESKAMFESFMKDGSE